MEGAAPGMPQLLTAEPLGQGSTSQPGAGQVGFCPGHLFHLACCIGTVMGEKRQVPYHERESLPVVGH